MFSKTLKSTSKMKEKKKKYKDLKLGKKAENAFYICAKEVK